MKKFIKLVLLILVTFVLTSCNIGKYNIKKLYEKNIEMAQQFYNYFLNDENIQLEVIDAKSANSNEIMQFNHLFSFGAVRILVVNYSSGEKVPIITEYKNNDDAQLALTDFVDPSLHLVFDNIIMIPMSPNIIFVDGGYQKLDDYAISYDGNYFLYDTKGATRKTINIPNGVKEIASGSLEGTGVETLICNDELEIIRSAALSDTNLKNVTLNNNLKRIEKLAFNNSKLSYVVIPYSVEVIGKSAFSNTTIYCNVDKKPNGWDDTFAENCEVYYKDEWEYISGLPQLK